MAKSKIRRGRGKGIGPVDVHVGARLRQRIGVSFQQMQKYENGMNRISASRLFALSRVFDVPVEYFFDDMPREVAASSPAQGGGKAKKLPSYEPDPMTKRETMEFVRAYYKIEDTNVRKRLYKLAKTLGAADA